MELDGDIGYRIRNEVETHVFPEMEGHEFFVLPKFSPNSLPNLRKYKNFNVSKVAVKASFLWFNAAFVIGILKNAQSI